jgi:hypothetical protein
MISNFCSRPIISSKNYLKLPETREIKKIRRENEVSK